MTSTATRVRGWVTAGAQIMTPPNNTVRPLAWASLITTIGNGMWYASWVLFFTLSVGLSPAQVGVGFVIGGITGLAAGPLAGHLGDRFGPREVLIAVALCRGLSMAAFTLVHSFWSFVAVVSVSTMADRCAGPPRTSVIIGLTSGATRTDTLAWVRAVGSFGFAVGAGLAAPVLAISTHRVFVLMVLANAATFVAYAIIIGRLPHVPATRGARTHERRRGLRNRLPLLSDVPYVTVNLLSGVLAVNWAILSTAAPLWVSRDTHVGNWIIAVLVVINAGLIALFQRRVSRHKEDPGVAARTTLTSTLAMAVACGVFALSGSRGGVIAAAVLIVAELVHVYGELLWVAGSWGLSIGLMPDHDHGLYQSVYTTGESGALVIAPGLMTLLVVGLGSAGWFVLALGFVLVGVAIRLSTNWALRSRPATSSVTATAMENR